MGEKLTYINGKARSKVLKWKEGVVSRKFNVDEDAVFDFNLMGRIRDENDFLVWRVVLKPGFFFPDGSKSIDFDNVHDACTVMDEMIKADWVNRIIMEDQGLTLEESETKIATMLAKFAPEDLNSVSEEYITQVAAKARGEILDESEDEAIADEEIDDEADYAMIDESDEELEDEMVAGEVDDE